MEENGLYRLMAAEGGIIVYGITAHAHLASQFIGFLIAEL